MIAMHNRCLLAMTIATNFLRDSVAKSRIYTTYFVVLLLLNIKAKFAILTIDYTSATTPTKLWNKHVCCITVSMQLSTK